LLSGGLLREHLRENRSTQRKPRARPGLRSPPAARNLR
jgi:hypothetical protein